MPIVFFLFLFDLRPRRMIEQFSISRCLTGQVKKYLLPSSCDSHRCYSFHNTHPTKRAMFFLTYLYYSITPSIRTWFSPRGSSIIETISNNILWNFQLSLTRKPASEMLFIKTPLHYTHNYSTKNYLNFITWLLYAMLIMCKNSKFSCT